MCVLFVCVCVCVGGWYIVLPVHWCNLVHLCTLPIINDVCILTRVLVRMLCVCVCRYTYVV